MSILNLNKKIEEKNKKEFEGKSKAFLEDYKSIVEKHKLGFKPQLSITEDGIMPTVVIADFSKVLKNRENDKKDKSK